MVSTNKVLATVASELFIRRDQDFSQFGSEKRGLPTNYYLTLAPIPIRLHAELNTVEFVAIQKPLDSATYDPLKGLAHGGTIYLQSGMAQDQVWNSLPLTARRDILARKLRLWV